MARGGGPGGADTGTPPGEGRPGVGRGGGVPWGCRQGPGAVLVCSHLASYPTPVAIGTPWNPGTVLGALVGSQLGTGALLGLHYSPGARTAHHSVAQLPREGHHGRGARLGHSGAASTVLLGALGHGGRGALHGSHRGAAGALYLGPGAYGALAALASLGYTLPLGALGYWGATVTTSLPGGVPCTVPWLLGGEGPGDPSLPRYCTTHSLLPLPVLGPLAPHLSRVHRAGTSPGPGLPSQGRVHFQVWLASRDLGGAVQGGPGVLVQVYQGALALAHPDNSLEPSAVLTPLHLAPEWYYLGYYGVLKAVPGKSSGLLVLAGWSLGGGLPGEPYSAGPLPGTPPYSGRCQGAVLGSLPGGGYLWVGVQLPQGRYLAQSRGWMLVSLGAGVGCTGPGGPPALPAPWAPPDPAAPPPSPSPTSTI